MCVCLFGVVVIVVLIHMSKISYSVFSWWSGWLFVQPPFFLAWLKLWHYTLLGFCNFSFVPWHWLEATRPADSKTGLVHFFTQFSTDHDEIWDWDWNSGELCSKDEPLCRSSSFVLSTTPFRLEKKYLSFVGRRWKWLKREQSILHVLWFLSTCITVAHVLKWNKQFSEVLLSLVPAVLFFSHIASFRLPSLI